MGFRSKSWKLAFGPGSRAGGQVGRRGDLRPCQGDQGASWFKRHAPFLDKVIAGTAKKNLEQKPVHEIICTHVQKIEIAKCR